MDDFHRVEVNYIKEFAQDNTNFNYLNTVAKHLKRSDFIWLCHQGYNIDTKIAAGFFDVVAGMEVYRITQLSKEW